MLYNITDPRPWIQKGYEYSSATYSLMDKSRRETRTEEPPGHTAWGAVSNLAGGALFGSKVAGLLGEAGLKLPALLGGGEEAATQAASGAAESAKGALGLNPWTTLIGAGIGLLSYLFS